MSDGWNTPGGTPVDLAEEWAAFDALGPEVRRVLTLHPDDLACSGRGGVLALLRRMGVRDWRAAAYYREDVHPVDLARDGRFER